MRVTRHLTYANVVATAALAVALGGTSYAAVHIGTGDIEDGAVTSPKLAGKAVTSDKINNSAVTPPAMNTSERFPINVNDANTLGGVSASTYLKAAMAESVFNRTESTPQTIITISGFGTLAIGCTDGAGFARFTNTSSSKTVVSIGSSGASLRSQTLQSGQAVNGPTATSAQIQTWRVFQGNSGSGKVGTAWVELVKGAGKDCAGSIQALSKH
jgi:hypothetical protein